MKGEFFDGPISSRRGKFKNGKKSFFFSDRLSIRDQKEMNRFTSIYINLLHDRQVLVINGGGGAESVGLFSFTLVGYS
jgi:hypothetical protein